MAAENCWGAPRIHGELLRLGFNVSERSVSRHLRSLPRAPRAGQTWKTFLRNHRDGIAAMDFFSVPTVTFRVLQVLLVIRHGRRDVARCAVTTIPTAAWVAQQLREAFPFDSAPRFMIFDRAAIFAAGVTARYGRSRWNRRAPAIGALGRMESPNALSPRSAASCSTVSSS